VEEKRFESQTASEMWLYYACSLAIQTAHKVNARSAQGIHALEERQKY
jgi:hypothetical protein